MNVFYNIINTRVRGLPRVLRTVKKYYCPHQTVTAVNVNHLTDIRICFFYPSTLRESKETKIQKKITSQKTDMPTHRVAAVEYHLNVNDLHTHQTGPFKIETRINRTQPA